MPNWPDSWQMEDDVLRLLSGPNELTVRFPLEGIARLTVGTNGDAPVESPAIAQPNPPLAPIGAHERSGGMEVLAGDLVVSLGSEVVTITSAAQTVTMSAVLEGDRWQLKVPLRDHERCYGLGEKTGFLDKRSRRYTMWNTDNPTTHVETLDPMYVSIPWIICFHRGSAYGLFLDDAGRSEWDAGRSDSRTLAITASKQTLDVYVVMGPSLNTVIERYTALTGRMPLLPRWALGYQQSRWSYESADELLAIARDYREREIPLDVLYADIDYMDGYRVFTWNPETFPDPSHLVTDLRADGVRLIPIVDPGVKKDGQYEVFSDGLTKGMYCLDADGMPFIGEVWPGEVAFPDFVRPEVRAWWGSWHERLTDIGIAGIWNDMNEPALFDTETKSMPDTVRHGPGGSLGHPEVHNLYGLYMGQATREALLRLRPDERPFVLTRSGFAGIQRHAAVWTGDNFSIWYHLEQSMPMVANLGLSGLPFTGPDVGGFSGDGNGELLARWTQLGAFTPFFRNHSAKGTAAQEPWAFGPEIEEICRRYIRLRYEWLPYLYTIHWRSTMTGAPFMRPLVFDFPDDPSVETLYDQVLVGSLVMLAPIVRPQCDRRLAYIPHGDWIDAWSLQRLDGGRYVVISAPLETLPLYVRAGSVIPKGPWALSTDQLVRDRLILAVYPGSRLAGEWYDDDGVSLAYERGDYNHWHFEGSMVGDRLTLRLHQDHAGYQSPTQYLTVILQGLTAAASVTFDDAAREWRSDERSLTIELPMVPGELTLTGLRSEE